MTKRQGKSSKSSKSSDSQSSNDNSSISKEDVKDESSSSTKNNNLQSARKSRQRQENSLGELTKNFIRYIREKGNRVVHINEVVKKLKVKKRRIYDITNVLEGTSIIYNK